MRRTFAYVETVESQVAAEGADREAAVERSAVDAAVVAGPRPTARIDTAPLA